MNLECNDLASQFNASFTVSGITASSKSAENRSAEEDGFQNLLDEILKQPNLMDEIDIEGKSTDLDPLKVFFTQERKSAIKLFDRVQREIENYDSRSGDTKVR